MDFVTAQRRDEAKGDKFLVIGLQSIEMAAIEDDVVASDVVQHRRRAKGDRVKLVGLALLGNCDSDGDLEPHHRGAKRQKSRYEKTESVQ